MVAPGTSVKEESRKLNPDRHSTWKDGLKAGVVGGAVSGIPFGFFWAMLGSAFAGIGEDAASAMVKALVILFAEVVVGWAIYGAIVGAVAGQLAVLRYQFDLTKLAVGMTIGFYILQDLLWMVLALFMAGGSMFALSGILNDVIMGTIMGGILGFMIGWADRTWFKKSKSHFDMIRRGHDGGLTQEERDEIAARRAAKAPKKILPEAPKGDPPVGHKVCFIPKNLPPMLAACKEGSRVKLEHLQKEGELDLTERTPKRKLAAIHIAAIAGVMEVADFLLSAGMNVDEAADRGMTPLYMAIQTANMNMVGYLLSRGANINHVNEDGFTPLHWACSVQHERLVGSTRVKMVELLLQKGADLQARDGQGRTARDLAHFYELKELGRFLDRQLGIEEQPVVQKQEEEEGEITVTAVEQLDQTEFVDYKPPEEEPVFTLPGTEVCKIPDGLSPVYQAVKEGDPHKTKLQLDEGGDIKEKVGAGLSGIHIASIVGAMGVVDLLVKSGADVNETCDRGMTPLFLAVQRNNTNAVGYLLSKGAKINHQNDDGLTALHWAAAVDSPALQGKVRVQMIELLIRQGADISIKDNQGRNPAKLAALADNENAAEYFSHLAKPADDGDDYDDDDDDDYHI